MQNSLLRATYNMLVHSGKTITHTHTHTTYAHLGDQTLTLSAVIERSSHHARPTGPATQERATSTQSARTSPTPTAEGTSAHLLCQRDDAM